MVNLKKVIDDYRLPGNIIVFEHHVNKYSFAPDVDVYSINDYRFNDLSTYFNFELFMRIFNENFQKALDTYKPVITVSFNPMIARVVKIMLDKYFGDMLDGFIAVSFFHDDRDTLKIKLENDDDVIDNKVEVIDYMLYYPYIQKFEIPHNAVLTNSFLYTLFD